MNTIQINNKKTIQNKVRETQNQKRKPNKHLPAE